jgi:hypothetical protein
VTIGHQRHTQLGCIIAAVGREFDIPPSAFIGLLEDEIFYHPVIVSCPRGKFRILRSDTAIVMFEIALCRGLYLVDCMTAFHPFSQVTSGTYVDKLHTLKPLE